MPDRNPLSPTALDRLRHALRPGWTRSLLIRRACAVVLLVVAVVAGLSAFAVVAYAGIGLLLGDARVTGELFTTSLIATVLYNLLLAPFVIPAVMVLARRTEVDPTRV